MLFISRLTSNFVCNHFLSSGPMIFSDSCPKSVRGIQELFAELSVVQVQAFDCHCGNDQQFPFYGGWERRNAVKET